MNRLFAAILCCAALAAAPPATANESIKRIRIAFVDTGNAGRSVMAEALANKLIADFELNAVVISRGVGINPYNTKPDSYVLNVLRDARIDVSEVEKHRATLLTSHDVCYSDLVLTMTGEHKQQVIHEFPDSRDEGRSNKFTRGKTFVLAEFAGKTGDVGDPFGKEEEVYKDLKKKLDEWLPLALAKALEITPEKRLGATDALPCH